MWKEVGSTKILNATGLDEWAYKLYSSGQNYSTTYFADYDNIAGRVCPPRVYISNANPYQTGKCLYYSKFMGQSPHYLGAHTGSDSWLYGNTSSCSSGGWRLPTIFETSASTGSSQNNYPASIPTSYMAASIGEGVPSHGSIQTWTGTTNGGMSAQIYYSWRNSIQGTGDQDGTNNYIRCVLP